MRSLAITPRGRSLKVLCLGAHSDDIEIGCGGTVLTLIASHPRVEFDWVVLSATGKRRKEAEVGASAFLSGAARKSVSVKAFRDGYFPYIGEGIKDFFEELKKTVEPDLILTHHRRDLHQDHRLVSELTWNTFRDHLILEYEILKYDGDLGSPNIFVALEDKIRQAKIKNILTHFPTQAGNSWFTADSFQALMRLRGVESNAPAGYAEAFYGRKLILS